MAWHSHGLVPAWQAASWLNSCPRSHQPYTPAAHVLNSCVSYITLLFQHQPWWNPPILAPLPPMSRTTHKSILRYVTDSDGEQFPEPSSSESLSASERGWDSDSLLPSPTKGKGKTKKSPHRVNRPGFDHVCSLAFILTYYQTNIWPCRRNFLRTARLHRLRSEIMRK